MNHPVKQITALGFPWETSDPFLFCVHHEDFYPKGNKDLGPESTLEGRNLGNDFTIKDGFRMYHGTTVPGFPAHPHRGFETVTIAKKGLVDHSDSIGAAGRFGNGDVQWMTAGRGVQHSEMFPLLNDKEANPFELFQIWLNLPKSKKMVDPHFAMLWKEDIPVYEQLDDNGNKTIVDVIAGELNNLKAVNPAPDSWASDPANEIAIWTIRMEADAVFKLPKASEGVNRRLYFYKGDSLKIASKAVPIYHAVRLGVDQEVLVENGAEEAQLLLLQGRPIDEPVVQHGPFVMNTAQEIQNTMHVFQSTQFGGWPWPSHDHVHAKDAGRFAKFADGSIVKK
ncbi:pirin family protein [Lutimonas sp.]|uniref:pirin family protein n=1 Tax=Lutimonas sp. TaxID=1872403 RepID=UPI003D9B8BBE